MQSTQGLLISADDGAVDLCVIYMRATCSKYILHKASKPATCIWVRLIIGCVQYTLKYGNYLPCIASWVGILWIQDRWCLKHHYSMVSNRYIYFVLEG